MPSTVKLPAIVTLEPLIVIAVVEDALDLITSCPPAFDKLPKIVPSSFKTTSPPPASILTSPAESKVIVDAEVMFAIAGLVKVLFVSVFVVPVNLSEMR